ncbi:hypothetical protein ACHAPA_005509 [Fusarium lateritium]
MTTNVKGLSDQTSHTMTCPANVKREWLHAKCDGARPQCARCRKAAVDCVFETPRGLSLYGTPRTQLAKSHAVLKLLHEGNLAESIQVLQTVRNSTDLEHAVDSVLASASEQRSHTLGALIEMLDNESEDSAIEVLRSLRQGRSSEATLRSTSGDMSGRVTPSLHTTNRSLLPPTQTPLEFQLVVEHANVYPSLAPLDSALLDLQLLGIRPLGVKTSPVSAENLSSTVDPRTITEKGTDCRDTSPVGARLSHKSIRRWTRISISDQHAAKAISLYLKMNQPWWSFFDTDLFLDDFASGKTDFCSQLLVNALLAWSTQSYAHYEPMVASLSKKFLDEALLIYNRERDVDRLTTVAATSIMSMTFTTLGRDKACSCIQYESACMAMRLGLYAGPGDSSRSPMDLGNEKVRRAASATAWGSFNFQMVMSMSYHQEPLPKRPPMFPIPGEVRGSVSVPDTPCPESTYIFVCRFWLVAFEMNYLYYSQKAASVMVAINLYHKLLAWAQTLPAGVRRDEHSPDHVLNLHIWFHTTVIDLFRPFSAQKPQPELSVLGAVRTTPASLIAASIQQLKRLVYQYRSNFESAKYSIIWQSGMLYLVNHILRDLSNNEAQFYFLLCIRGYQYLARYMPFVSGIMKSIFAIALQQGIVLKEDTRRLLREVQSENHSSHGFFSAYPVDLAAASNDLPGSSLEKLVEYFEGLEVDMGKESEDATKPHGWKGDAASMHITLTSEDNGMA